MKHRLVPIIAALVIGLFPSNGRGDFWGGDIPLLLQIVLNTTQELVRLKQLIDTGQDQLGLIREINRGINDTIRMIQTAFPNIDPGIYKNWENASAALREIEAIYGAVPVSADARIQRDTDQSVAEAVSLNNSIYKYTQDIDSIGESIKELSHQVSPGGAQKLTAQSMGVMLNVMNQNLRAQATGLKLQAETLAIQNRKEKEMSRHLASSTGALSLSLSQQQTDFKLPEFR